jgi:hypothetical protein
LLGSISTISPSIFWNPECYCRMEILCDKYMR